MLGFIFDNIMILDDNGNYYDLTFNNALWNDRYLPIFKKMIVSSRVKRTSESEDALAKKYRLSGSKDVIIKPISSYKEIPDLVFRRGRIIEQLSSTIDACDEVIVRLPSPLGSVACNLCRKKGKKYAVEMVADPWDGYWHHTNKIGKVVAPIMLNSTKKQCRLARWVVYVTEDYLQSKYPTNGRSICASNVMIESPSHEVLARRLKKISSGDMLTLGLVGRTNLKSKGHAVALKALRLLKDKYPNIVLEFLGDGDEKYLSGLIEKLGLKNNVRYVGPVSSGEPVLKWMDHIDILLVPSFQEGLPRAMIEGMSRACPCVGARTGGIPELVGDEVIHKAGDYKKLALDIEKIISDRKFAKELAEKNFNESKKYAKEILDRTRNRFWRKFHDA